MSEMRRIRVIIADDQELVRAGFSMVIGSQADMQVVAQANDGAQAVALSETLHPDVVLMDVRMPGMDGIEATRRISTMNTVPPNPDAKVQNDDCDPQVPQTTHVIILTTFDLDEYVMSAINAGASGFLLKDTEPETLLNSIRTVFQGNAIIAPTATKRLIEKMLDGEIAGTGPNMQNGQGGMNGQRNGQLPYGAQTDGNTSAPARYTDPELDDLTERELEVLIEIAHGLSNQEIADKLFISLPTVKTHVAHILAKINARDRVQAVVFAYENGLIEA
ncbi:DNA-binding response regulator [Bifidobacterium tibiigranuli]|jgi:DNA-binding NarL/FixJ family response regulator|uniref:DNA-binding response regulator n=1 Tax=Bifidobacterium tibiigranuli TaxID=2172043 RepID=A0A5N6RUX4_9BIFI|nr:response regulator transcription factor [Bifidobacterium tibiigranuli]KAE8126256.1 DNA-binding response regulator [Bifidobacterium tibiigranuli]KAE8126273.1 DNA-binding response regulator [Bifidobacterium tibiigranuli]MCH3974813.1 response regulator transcription factor [Bifidobacterium tibiigranuli]MCH4190433.1 response regulator transcription factor [Bifidobacterium tibiigranuli]MCH4204756.1 response regulator transcription factor [Bifidobacterium tibiigranuli]